MKTMLVVWSTGFSFGFLGLIHSGHLPSPWMCVERLPADPSSSTRPASRQTPSNAIRSVYITPSCIITVAAQLRVSRYVTRVWWEYSH